MTNLLRAIAKAVGLYERPEARRLDQAMGDVRREACEARESLAAWRQEPIDDLKQVAGDGPNAQ